MRWARWHVGSLFVYDVSTMFPWYHQPAKQPLMFAVFYYVLYRYYTQSLLVQRSNKPESQTAVVHWVTMDT